MHNIYLDSAATTKLTPEVKQYIIELLDQYANPSSLYQSGIDVRQVIEQARKNVANFINGKSENIIFTSGGSASNTLAIRGYIQRNNCTVLYSPISHKSIIKCVESIKNAYPLKVNKYGQIDFDDLKEWLDSRSGKFFVVLDYANSEIGAVQDVKKIINLVHSYNGVVYLDCTGSINQISIDVNKLNADIIGFSGHKIHALKGIGVLYKKENIELEPLVYGSQEQGLFAGTENVLGIASLGNAIETYDYSSISSNNRDYVYDYNINNIPDSYLIGAPFKYRLPHNLYICFKGVQGESLMILLDMNEIQVSTGSACTSNDLQPSSTLTAIGIDKEDINSCIRMTFSDETKEELDYVCSKLKECVEKLRNLNK